MSTLTLNWVDPLSNRLLRLEVLEQQTQHLQETFR
jgi:hypothetical protein